MGRLYEKEMIGDKTIGYFSNGSVTRGQGIMSDTSAVVKYSNGHIYSSWMGSSLSNQIAYCDEYGNLYNGNGGGSVLAKLENGIVYNAPAYGRKEIARYDGDMYGAAAAVAALMLGLADESDKSSVQNSDGECVAGAVKSIFVLLLKLLTFSLTPVIGAVVCMVLNSGFVLPFIPHLIIALCLFDARRKGLISENRGYLAAILQNLHWIILFLGFIPFFEVLLNPIMKSDYIVLIIMYCMPILAFLIVWTGVRKHKKAIRKQKKLLKKQEKEQKKQEKLQEKNKNT